LTRIIWVLPICQTTIPPCHQSPSNIAPAPASRTTLVFAEPPGLEGVLLVGAEHGDVVVRVDLAGRPFCALVLTADDALTLSMWLCAHIVDERRRRHL
jgi:hypothetical protein